MENAQTETKTESKVDTTDYKALYEQTNAELTKQKGIKDNYAKENAEYKRQEAERKKKELETLPEVERLQKELEASQKATNEANAKVAEMLHRQSGLENGFSVEEVEKLVGTNVDFKVLKEIVSARVDEAVKSTKAEATKASTTDNLLDKGSANKETKSDFKKYQESKQKQSNIVEL